MKKIESTPLILLWESTPEKNLREEYVKTSDHEKAMREKDEELRRTKGYLSKMSDMYSTLNINYNNLDVEKTKITSENTKLRELLEEAEVSVRTLTKNRSLLERIQETFKPKEDD